MRPKTRPEFRGRLFTNHCSASGEASVYATESHTVAVDEGEGRLAARVLATPFGAERRCGAPVPL